MPGDDPAVIASGPTVGDPTTAVVVLKVLDFQGIAIPVTLRARLESDELETPKPGDPRLAKSEFRMVASPRQMLEAAAAEATRLGITPLILGDAIEGEAREVGKALAGMAVSCGRHGFPAKRPCVLLSCGETTVTLKGTGAFVAPDTLVRDRALGVDPRQHLAGKMPGVSSPCSTTCR